MIPSGEKPQDDEFRGHAESSIIERFGQPTDSWQGHFGIPPSLYGRRYSEAASAMYERPDGTLCLSYCWELGKWVCFASSWLPKGWAF